MPIQKYIEKIKQLYLSEYSGEHTYRADLQNLLTALIPQNIVVINEPAKIKCGKPDYMLFKDDIELGAIETKDIGKDLNSKDYAEQFERYKNGLPNLILTDYLYFELYRNGEKKISVRIAEIKNNAIIPLEKNYNNFIELVKDFIAHTWQSITLPTQLAKLMAGKAKLFAYVINEALNLDLASNAKSDLTDQIESFKEVLLHDIEPAEFSDIYAQTIAYGMFTARLHDTHSARFTRKKAARLIPLSNPFLKKLFSLIEKEDLDERITWVIESLVSIFSAVNVDKIQQKFKKATFENDPIIHFYETFLAEYNPQLRKSRGVWYTPQPVVNFIIRAVDDILKADFNLVDGLADSSKATFEIAIEGKRKPQLEEFHRVQILDPATGTGTFLAETIKHIHQTKAELNPQLWSEYVENHLIPRLNGFEILMASYAMAHLKLDLLLSELNFTPTNKNQRLNVYLTNSLEEFKQKDIKDLEVARWLLNEANAANRIKRDTPVMVVMGNPPYSVSSSNKSTWIHDLTDVYKKGLNEKNIQPLSDDYIKFIRFGQHFIEKNGSGVLAYISNNRFIDGLIHRQMRKNLLETFDKIYVLDLHGSNKKNELDLNGGKDENVFDIMQGVSINIFVKTGHKETNDLAEVYQFDFFGKRKTKYDRLEKESLNSIQWDKVDSYAPNYFFVPKDFDAKEIYDNGFSIFDLFLVCASGITTERDHLTIKFNDDELKKITKDILSLSEEDFRKKHTPKPDGRDWKISFAKQDIASNSVEKITSILYRPFDIRKTIYTGKSKGFMAYPRNEVMQHLRYENNLALLSCRQQNSSCFQHIFITNKITERCSVSLQTSEVGYVFPLYTYPETPKIKKLSAEKKSFLENEYQIESRILAKLEKCFNRSEKLYHGNEEDKNKQKLFELQKKDYLKQKSVVDKLKSLLDTDNVPSETLSIFNEEQQRRPNFNREIIQKIADKLGLKFTFEKETKPNTFAPIDLLDYIYAVLHSPTYREIYKEFLKIDFPRVPYPELENFWQLVELGSELRQLHLLESPNLDQFITRYLVDGLNCITRKVNKNTFELTDSEKQLGQIWINDSQYFDQVPLVAWNFYVGGYQPVQKWLKDRHGRKLSSEDILHYQKIIHALTETARIMQEIALVDNL
jgi:predicted helicase